VVFASTKKAKLQLPINWARGGLIAFEFGNGNKTDDWVACGDSKSLLCCPSGIAPLRGIAPLPMRRDGGTPSDAIGKRVGPMVAE
jgi:hypothetical protein